jgi:hypothetical protein
MGCRFRGSICVIVCWMSTGWVGTLVAETAPAGPAPHVRPSSITGVQLVSESRPAVEPAATTRSGARIQFEEPIFDFGRVDAGQVLTNNFKFTNIGTEPLEISGVRPGCGCTTAGEWERRLEPGQTGSIPIRVDSATLRGSVTKHIAVTSNDPTQPTVSLEFSVTVWRPIEIIPASAYFRLSATNPATSTRTVRIVSNLEDPLVLSGLSCTNDSFQVELKTLRPGKEFEVLITAVPPFASTRVKTAVTLKTSSPRVPQISFPVTAYSEVPVTVRPAHIILPAESADAGLQASVTIRNSESRTLTLSEASVNLEGAAAEVVVLQPGRLFRLTVSVPPGVRIRPEQNIEASVKTDHPRYPVIKIPVFQSGRRLAILPGQTFPTSNPMPLRAVGD